MSPLWTSLGFVFLYLGSSVGEVLALRSLAIIPLRLPASTALLSNQMWLFLLPSYILTLRGSLGQAHSLSLSTRLSQYIVCGLLTGAITICRNVSINLLPGSVFAILVSTSVLFSVLLCRVVSAARLNPWHYAAVLFCLGSACSIAFTALLTTQVDVKGANYPLGIPLALGAAFFVAIMGIAQELYQKTWAGPLFNLYLAEMTLVSSLVASACAVVYGGGVGELPTWTPELRLASSLSTSAQNNIIGVCAVLPLLKLFVRNGKYAIIQASSALFFEFVQASAAILISISSVLAFNEPFSPGFIAAVILMVLAFGLYSKAKIEAKRLVADDSAALGGGVGMNGSWGGLNDTLTTVEWTTSPVSKARGASGAGVDAWGETTLVSPSEPPPSPFITPKKHPESRCG